mmetsp:Transcript_22093/g.61402  ORF Transcript_22093/g.61402 Transcript_22093/m.61402 type:complete len:298 (-) Transcript_22093:52-945(-)
MSSALRFQSTLALGRSLIQKGAQRSNTTAITSSAVNQFLLQNHHHHPSAQPSLVRSFHATTSATLEERHGTTIVCVRKNGKVCMMGDGMVSAGSRVVKPNAKKIRRIMPKGDGFAGNVGEDDDDDDEAKKKGGTVVGFAGSTADAFTLLERLEGFLDEYPGQLSRSCVELAKGWRTDKYLRRLDAALLVADENISLELTGNGDVLESHDGVLGVGSGSVYAIAAARALMDIPELSAEDVARKAMNIAGDMCIYTNHEFMIETLDAKEESKEDEGEDEKDHEKPKRGRKKKAESTKKE